MSSTNTWTEAIQPVIDHAQGNHGFTKQLIDRVNARTGENTNRRNFVSWLHKDPGKRIEPKAGMGMVLLTEARALIGGVA